MARKLDFKTRAGYQKWLAYGHIHGDFERVKGNTIVSIGGKRVYPEHNKGKRRKGLSTDDMFKV